MTPTLVSSVLKLCSRHIQGMSIAKVVEDFLKELSRESFNQNHGKIAVLENVVSQFTTPKIIKQIYLK